MDRRKLLLTAPLLAALLFSCVRERETAAEVQQDAQQETAKDGSLVPGEVILELDDEMILALENAQAPTATKSADFNSLAEMLEVYSIERVFPDAGKFEPRHREAGLHRWYKVRFREDAPSTKAGGSVEDFFRIPGVLTVEIPRREKEQSFNYFNDPYAYYCWSLYNDGTLGSGFKKGSDINVIPVWEQFTTGSKDVVVAVVDSGVELTHEDLQAIVLAPGPGGSQSFIAGLDPNEIPAGDHGTNVAGIIAAVNNNGFGGSSVAGGGKDGLGGVRIMSCAASDGKTESMNGSTSNAIVWAADNGATIVNNSWGHTYETEQAAKAGSENFERESSSSRAAIDYFIDHAGIDENGRQVGPMKGGLVLFSAGNEAFAYGTPASYSRVVAVGSFQHNNTISSFSNYGPWVDVWAPGGGTDSGEQMIFGPIRGNTYAWMAGTSQACPNAAGVAALLLSYYGGPGFTAEELKERLVYGAAFGVLNFKGKVTSGGRLDAYGAFTYSGRDEIRFTTDYAGGFTFKSHESARITYTIHGNDDQVFFVDPFSDSPIVEVAVNGNTVTFQVDAMKGKAGVYKAGFTVGKGTKFEKSLELAFSVLANNSPRTKRTIDNLVLDAETGETVTLDLSEYFEDPDGEALVYSTAVETGSTASATVSGGILSVKALTYGETAITVKGADAHGEEAVGSFSVLNRDKSRLVDLYPNPVTTNLFVRPSKDGNVTVKFYNAVGAKVLDKQVSAGLYQPASIDVSSLASGLYTVVAELGTEEYRANIMKL